MRSQSVSGFWITTVISLIGVDIGLPGGSAALAQEGACGTIESDPPADPADPDLWDPLPAYCFGPGGPGLNVCTDNGCIIDVLVVYTPAARDAAGGTAGINVVIGAAVDAMNIAFVNSQIPSFVRLVGTAEVVYDETDDTSATEALGCLLYASCMPLAHVLRDELKADIVSLFVTRLSPGIIGIVGDNKSFNVVQWNYAAADGSWVFAHEMGHDLGAGHQVGIPCTPTAGQCHAYVYNGPPGPSFRTIMRSVAGGNIQHYSNPNVSYLGVPTGYAGCANNAWCIRDRAPGAGHRRRSDCNLNGICDAHDTAVGYSADCDRNGIPDECSINGGAGVCCVDGVCIDTDISELCCLYRGGMFGGYLSDFSTCGQDCNVNGVDDACESPGACCYSDYGTYCNVIPEDCCIASGGTFRGAGTRCGGDLECHNGVPDGCESGPWDPLGACCFAGVEVYCEVMLASCCASVGGTFGGAGTYCEDCNRNGWPAPCEGPATQEYGACCNGEGACIIATECSCPGSFFGVGTVCPPGVMCPFVRP